ncbi:MAG: peptide-methionine (S)-S-oxide reductase MsrA [Candidatus Dormibacteria bacterium]
MLEVLRRMNPFLSRATLPTAAEALPGRADGMPIDGLHTVLGHPLCPPFPEEMELAIFAMGCFWGAERRFWTLPGIHTTAAGYSGGLTPNPTYQEVCSGRTGHAEAVLVVFDPKRISYGRLLQVFWESHDPTQGMRQGADSGTQYRSALYCTTSDQAGQAEASRADYQSALTAVGMGQITTEISVAGHFYYAEQYHQQYLDKNPHGYCGMGGTGVACPVGVLGAI